MYKEAMSGSGFEKSWQDKLHQFYLELIPGEFRKSIDHCERLVVIPHHVLHYFPFAALVVEPDRTERAKMELPQPKFLIERSIEITTAPSLLSYFQPIKSDVVVLSACYSGLADRSPLPGDDLFGLQRAILQSGAKSVVSGLWDVYDDTAPELIRSTMTNFHGGQTISRSLAEAQREFLRVRKEAGASDPWVHPYFWAVYTCSGGGHSKFASR